MDNDLISRQAVSSWLKQYGQDVLHGKYKFSLIYIWKNLMDLPSAQPEPQWIPIAERLPKDGTWNIFTDGKNISVERYKADAIDHFFPAGRWFQLEDVIAWMPLPTPYRKGAAT